MKRCISCKKDKNDNQFTHDKSKPDGLYTICKKCLKIKREKLVLIKKEYDRQYRLKNIINITKKNKEYQKIIPNEIRAKHNREYRQRHSKKYYASAKKYRKNNKYKYAYRTLLFNFIQRAGINKNDSAISILGYDYYKFKKRIEFNFKEGMNWKNHGMWHIDHKKPVSKFKINTSAHIVNALSNLQPLWAEENLSKGNNF